MRGIEASRSPRRTAANITGRTGSAAGAQATAVLREAFHGATRVHHHSCNFRDVLSLA
jgi:hypothetical protein